MNAFKIVKYFKNSIEGLKSGKYKIDDSTDKSNEMEKLKEEKDSELIRSKLLNSKKKLERNSIAKKLKDLTFYRILYKKLPKIFLFFLNLYRITGVTIFFIFFQIIFVLLLKTLGPNFYEIWVLQATVTSEYLIFVYSTVQANKSNFLKIFKIMTSIFILIVLIGMFLIVIILFSSLITLSIILAVLISYYALNIFSFIKSHREFAPKTKLMSLFLICLTLSSNIVTTTSIYFLPNTIEIQPKTSPEIVFLCGSSELPTDPEILDMCKKYNIGFMSTIRDYMIGNDAYMRTYKKVLAHEINLYFLIGGNSSFYAYIDNAREFPLIYKSISKWFVDEGIMENPCVSSFSIDAETPTEILERLYGENLSDSVKFGYNNYPTLKEIENATNAFVEFTDLIKKDGKKCGMVHAARYFDPADGDGDLSLYMRNIYSLKIKWDFTIPMMYRTNYFRESDKDYVPTLFKETSIQLFYGASIEGTEFTISELSFYQMVSMEQNSKSINSENQYVFIGNFEKEFKNTRYIREKEYLMDFDICRHFNKEKIFFYDLQGFLYHYGWEGIEELGKHNQQKNKCYLNYDNFQEFYFLIFYCFLIIIDIFAFFEKDLA